MVEQSHTHISCRALLEALLRMACSLVVFLDAKGLYLCAPVFFGIKEKSDCISMYALLRSM